MRYWYRFWHSSSVYDPCCIPLFPEIRRKRWRGKSKGWQFNVVIKQVISIWFWCAEINVILNCCLYTEGLYETTLRVWLHGEGTEMRRLPKEEIVSRLQNASSQFCFRWWYPVWYLWGEIIERKQSVTCKEVLCIISEWKILNFYIENCHQPSKFVTRERQHVFYCLIEYQFNTTGQQWWKVFLWSLSEKSWLTCML